MKRYRLLLAPGNFREAVRIQQGDGSAIDGEQFLIPKHAKQANGSFNCDAGHLGHFFPFERESDPDMIVVYFPESIAEVQQQAGQPLAGRLEGELIEMIHIDSHFIAEELDQLDRQLRISADDLEIAFLVDDTDLRRLQCLARHFMKGAISEDVLLDQLAGTQDPDNLPLASRRRTSQFDLSRAEQIEAQTYMAFIKDGLVRCVIESAFDFLEFSEVAAFDIAEHDLCAKPAGIAMLDETRLPFHDLPFLVPTRHRAKARDSQHGHPGMFTPNPNQRLSKPAALTETSEPIGTGPTAQQTGPNLFILARCGRRYRTLSAAVNSGCHNFLPHAAADGR